MTNLTEPETKTKRIRELLLARKTPKQVAEEVETSREYVYKEKGKMKKAGLLVTHQSLSIANGNKEIIVTKDDAGFDKYQNNPQSLERQDLDFNIPPLEKKDVQSMYDRFERKNMTASEVTAELGIRPDISQKEFQRFLSMKSRDPFDLQNRLTSEIDNLTPVIQSLVDKAARCELLTNDELISLINFRTRSYARQYIVQAVSDPDIIIHRGLNRYVCRYCHVTEPGVIFGPISYCGKSLEVVAKKYCCLNCKGIADQAYQDFKKDSSKL